METRVALIGIIVTQESSVAALNELLHQYGQHKAMTEQNWSREEFIAHFGKNYLDEAQIWGIEHPDDSWDNESAFQLVEEGAVLPF